MPVQLGGGIRDMRTVAGWLDTGVDARHHRHRGGARSRPRARGGAAAIPAASRSASTRATAASRSRAGRGSPRSSALDLGRRFEDAGVAAIIYTDIDRDGVLQGLNIAQTRGARRAR